MLLGSDRSLVHHEPGTTRDAVTSIVSLSGVPLRLIDTAGLRPSLHEIEAAGISISINKLRSADLVVLVLDYSRPLDVLEASHLELLSGKRVLCVVNKTDLPGRLPEAIVSARLSSNPIHTCAISGKGRRELEERILNELFGPHLPELGSPLIFTEQLRDLVSRLGGDSPPFDELAVLLEPIASERLK